MIYNFLCSVDKRNGLNSPDYLFVLKSGWTYRAEQIMDGQKKASFTKSCLCLKVKMAIFYAEYIFDGQNNWAFPKSCLCSKVKMAIFYAE